MELNHVAVFIDNLDTSTLGPALGGWAGPAFEISKQPVTVNGRPGEHSGRTRRIRTAGDFPLGVSVEDVAPGAPIQPVPGNAWHHIAVWCDDVPGTVQSLEAQGYEKDVVGRGPDGELATFAYMISSMGPRLEIADTRIKEPMIARYRETQIPADQGFVPCEVATVVKDADALEALKRCWNKALATEWRDVVDSSVSVVAADGDRDLRMRSVSSVGDPCVTIIAPETDSMSLLAPVATNGWHHVTFQCGDLSADLSSFDRAGFMLEYCDRGPKGSPHSFAMLVAPEGTRIKLTRKAT